MHRDEEGWKIEVSDLFTWADKVERFNRWKVRVAVTVGGVSGLAIAWNQGSMAMTIALWLFTFLAFIVIILSWRLMNQRPVKSLFTPNSLAAVALGTGPVIFSLNIGMVSANLYMIMVVVVFAGNFIPPLLRFAGRHIPEE